jgi:iron complex transport system substrate-binding protein
MLFALGQERRLVGRSTGDAYPAAAQQVPSLGGAIRPNVEAVLAARPDLVVLYASGDNRAAAGQLRAASVPVVALKIDHVADFARALEVLGGATCAPDRARTRSSVVWPVGTTPLLVVGGVGFQHELLVAAGARNAFADQQRPAAQVSAEEVLARDPDAVLVSPTRARRDSLAASPQWRGLRATRTGRLLVYDTALVLRPSVQLGAAAVSLARLFHPSAASRLPSLPGERR